MTETTMVPLSIIKDNPWRDRVRNPIDDDRVEAIGGSIKKTKKYWLGTYGRRVGKFVELAFGHNRFEAAKAQGLKEIPITLEDFTDGDMLVWMAQENVRGELPVVIEAVAAAVKALGDGKIEIEAPDPKTNAKVIRYAPSFIAGKASVTTVVTHPYTLESLAVYLGYVKKASNTAKNSVVAAMGILERAEIAGAEGDKRKAVAMEKSLAKLPVNQAVKAISDIKEREDKVKQREVKTAAETAEFDRQQREIQTQRKKVEEEAEEKCQKEVERLAKAKAEANKPKIEAIKEKIKEIEDHAVEKNLALEVKAAELEKQVQARKAREAEAKKEDAYLPIRREEDRLIHKMEQFQESFREEAKALSRNSLLNLKSRERLWQGADALEGYAGWLKSLFVNMAQLNPRRKSTNAKRKG